MMKVYKISILYSAYLLTFLISFTLSLNAQRKGTYYYPQFFRGVGLFIAANHSMHHYVNNNARLKDFFNPVFTYYYPPSHYSREYFSWGVGIFAEFLPFDNIRWQTELEYTHKGAKERLLLDWFWGSVSDKFYPNKYTYLQWNNYLKWFFLRNNYGTFYWMFGIRLEYLLGQSISVYAPISSSFPKLWWSGDIALGYEWDVTWFRYFHPFVEYHWNPDVIYHRYKKDLYDVKVRNITFELRFGLIFRPKGRAIDDCNAPKYRGVEF